MRQEQVKIITDGDLSQATVVTNGIDLQQVVVGSVQAVWTGNPTGNFTIEISNDKVAVSSPDPSSLVTNWTTYTGSTQAAGGASGNWVWDLSNIGYRWVRLKYSRSGGTGLLNVTWCGKGF